MKKINDDNSIIINNISKIRMEIRNSILSINDEDVMIIFNQGINLFKEFIKNFGSKNIESEKKTNVENFIEKIISRLKTIIKKYMEDAFSQFDPKHFLKAFDSYLTQKYEDKKKIDDKTQSDFISDCKDYIITPTGDMYRNYGIFCESEQTIR